MPILLRFSESPWKFEISNSRVRKCPFFVLTVKGSGGSTYVGATFIENGQKRIKLDDGMKIYSQFILA